LHQVGTSFLLIYMMHGHTYIKSPKLNLHLPVSDGNAVPVHTMTAYGGAEVWPHIFLTSARYKRRRSTSSISPFMLRERTTVPTEQKSGWAPGPVWTFWRRKEYLATARNKIPDHPVHSCNTYSNCYK